MEAVVLLRDCVSFGNVEDNIDYNEDDNTLCFVKDSNRSTLFNLNDETPLLSQSNKLYTLHQLYLFALHYEKGNWSDYILEALDQRIDDEDQYLLYDYIHGNSDIFNGLNQNTLKPKPFVLNNNNNNINNNNNNNETINSIQSIHPSRKRKLNDDNNYPSNKRIKINNITDNNNNNNSLFNNDPYISSKHTINNSLYDENIPFWQTLPDPKPNLNVNSNPPIDWKLDYRSRIRESSTRNSILNASGGKSFDDVAQYFARISNKIQDYIQKGEPPKRIYKRTKQEIILTKCIQKPIIIVPNSNNSLITFKNCNDFLLKYEFNHPHINGSRSGSMNGYHAHNNTSNMYNHSHNKKDDNSSDNNLIIQKKSVLAPSARLASFEIRSSSSFGKNTCHSDWDRIVAIFVIGKSWQFKKWKEGWRKPEEIFNKAVGFYLHFSGDPPKGDVNKWNVKQLAIQRNLRHDDARIANDIWKTLYRHLKSKHKNKKLYY